MPVLYYYYCTYDLYLNPLSYLTLSHMFLQVKLLKTPSEITEFEPLLVHAPAGTLSAAGRLNKIQQARMSKLTTTANTNTRTSTTNNSSNNNRQQHRDEEDAEALNDEMKPKDKKSTKKRKATTSTTTTTTNAEQQQDEEEEEEVIKPTKKNKKTNKASKGGKVKPVTDEMEGSSEDVVTEFSLDDDDY